MSSSLTSMAACSKNHFNISHQCLNFLLKEVLQGKSFTGLREEEKCSDFTYLMRFLFFDVLSGHSKNAHMNLLPAATAHYGPPRSEVKVSHSCGEI